MTYWLMSEDALAERQLRVASAAAGRAVRADADASPALSVAGNVARIGVRGSLGPTRDPWSDSSTAYPDLQAALSAAMTDPSVSEIVWDINSPGGMVDGLFPLLDDIASARASGRKPMRVEAENAHSAAYGIAAAVGKIAAVSRASSFGSVGVAASYFKLGEMIGKSINLTSSVSPEKRPDVGTPEGAAVVTRYLDQIAAEFVSSIAAGRGVTPGEVADNFGRGASMLASEAQRAGLIDSIAAPNARYKTVDEIAALKAERDQLVAASAALSAEVSALKSELAALKDATAKASHASNVDAAIKAGKLAPALRAWASGVSAETLSAYLAAAPALPVASAPVAPPAVADASALTAAELEVCRQSNIKPEAFAARKARLLAAGSLS